VAEAGVALTTLRVEDPQVRLPSRRAGAVPGDDHPGPLTDHVATEPDPGATGELQADGRGLADGARQARVTDPGRTGRVAGRWLKDDDGDARPPGERREAGEPVAERCASPGSPDGKVQDDQVDRPAREELAGDLEPFPQRSRRHQQEPVELDAARHGLDRIEARGEVHPGDDRTRRLGRRGKPEGEGGPAAREIATEGGNHAAGESARAEQGIEVAEPGGEDPPQLALDGWPGPRPDARLRLLERNRGQRTDHLAGRARSSRAPALAEPGEGGGHVRGGGGHAGQYRTNVRLIQEAAGRFGQLPGRSSGAAHGPCYTLGPSRRLECAGAPVGM
jgi:hypothetical protein